MFTVETRVLGNYTATGYADTVVEALEIAAEQLRLGWIHVRIITPAGDEVQVEM